MRIVRLEDLQQFAAVNLLSDPGHIAGPKIIPNAAMVRLNWSLPDGKVGHNILYGTYSGSPALSAALADQIFTTLKSVMTSSGLQAFLSTTTSLTGVTLLDVRSTTGAEINSTGAAILGTSTGNPLPDETALVVTIRTAVRGPGGRGRFYIPGWGSAAQGASGSATVAVQNALQTWATTGVFAAINTNVGSPILALPARAAYTSPSTGRVFPARAAGSLPVTSYLVRDNHWDSQRRRGLK